MADSRKHLKKIILGWSISIAIGWSLGWLFSGLLNFLGSSGVIGGAIGHSLGGGIGGYLTVKIISSISSYKYSQRDEIVVSSYCAIGVGIGAIIALYIMEALSGEYGEIFDAIGFAIGGGVSGSIVGLAFATRLFNYPRKRLPFVLTILAWAMAFCISHAIGISLGWIIFITIPLGTEISSLISFMIGGAISGFLVGIIGGRTMLMIINRGNTKQELFG